MKKKLKIILPIIILVISGLFFFKNDLKVWSVVNKYKTDPSSIYLYGDIPDEICEAAREAILDVYLAKRDTSEESLKVTVDLIKFVRDRLFEPSIENNKPLHEKSFDVLMDIYKQTENVSIRREIVGFIKDRDIKAFYKYFEMTQKDGISSYDDDYQPPYGYPRINNELDVIEKELWCKNVKPKIEANYIAILKADTFRNTLLAWKILSMYEETGCNQDRLYLKKIHFIAWSELLANFEEEFISSQNPKKVVDFDALRYSAHIFSSRAKNKLEATNLMSLLNLNNIPDDLKAEAEKELLLYFLDYPIKSRTICREMVHYIGYIYGKKIKKYIDVKTKNKEVLTKVKAWLKLVDKKYPELSIYEYWEHQRLMAGY
jgi:hypothetical protein